MFIDKNQFSLHIEDIKIAKGFESYIESIVYFYENETDQEMAEITKMLNGKIIEHIRFEAEEQKLLKNNDPIIRLI